MKATGIIRRVDNLGRIVIPKEIRRTLRIREGDPMEAFMQDGCVMFKKYSPMGEMSDFAQSFADSLFEATSNIALICDMDNIIAVAGASKRTFLNKPVWNLALKVIEDRDTQCDSYEEMQEEFDYLTQVVAPIICQGDVIGAIGLISKERVGITEQKLVETIARFLAKQMEQ